MKRAARKVCISYRVSAEAKALLDALAAKLGISQTSVLELLIRKAAEAEHITTQDKGT